MRLLSKTNLAWLLAAASLSVACQAMDQPNDGLDPEDRDPGAADGKAEAWNSANNPAYVDSNFLYMVSQLPVEGGSAQPPIAGDYWATARDNLNVKWDGDSSMSAAEKFGKAFGKPDTQEQVSQANGVKSASWRKACTTNSDCSDQNDGSICAASYDNAEHRCVPTWWGICHGWSPFALSEPTPSKAVTRTAADGTVVTFYPGDIIGLMSLVYTNVETKFLSSRCEKMTPPVDSNGRIIDGTCRDMNPGSWHVLVTNMMGVRKQGFVLDQTYDDQVWNQPAWKYTITNARGGQLVEISKGDAMGLLGLNVSMTSLLDTSDVKKDEQKTGSYTATDAGTIKIKMTGTGDADLYVKKGAAPTLDAYDCRPYTGSAVEECSVTVAAGDQVFWLINGYAATSSVQLGVALPNAAGTYTYNTSATKFFDVQMDFTFIVEARPGHTAANAESYASTKHYTYVLEADDNGKILGGEWYGASMTDHPDFAWYPTAKPTQATAGIDYETLRALNNEAASAAAPAPGVNETKTLATSVTLPFTASTKSKYFTVTVPAGVKQLRVDMTGTGDADLYVRKNSYPTVSVFSCKSATSGTANESCTTTVSSPGLYYVRARNMQAGSVVTITATLLK